MKPFFPKPSAAVLTVSSESATTPLERYVDKHNCANSTNVAYMIIISHSVTTIEGKGEP